MGAVKNKTIYILPGWAYSTEKWDVLVKLLKEAGIKTHKLNIPGLTAPLDKPWTIDDYTTWLDKELRDEKGEIVLLGHSNGGRIALSYVLNYPEKVTDLILIGSSGLIKTDLKSRLKRIIFNFLAVSGKKLRLPKYSKLFLYKLAREDDYYKASPVLKKTMVNLISVDLKDRLSEIKIPTTIIWGEEDKITPLSFANTINNNIQGSNLFIIKNARHSPQFEYPLKVFEIIKDAIL